MAGEQDRRPRPHRGRLRNEQARLDILDAALELAEDGLDHVTIDRIAARSGVGKQTVYRWWPSKWEVVLEALLDRAERDAPSTHAPSTGTSDGQPVAVEQFLVTAFAAITGSRGTARLLRALMAQAQLEEQFEALWRARFVQPRRAVLSQLLTEASRRGELRAGLDPQVATDVLFGAMWYRLLVGHAPLDAEYAAQLAGLVRNSRPIDIP